MGLAIDDISPSAALQIELSDAKGAILSRFRTRELRARALVGVPAIAQGRPGEPSTPIDTSQVRCLSVRDVPAESPPGLGRLSARMPLRWPAEQSRASAVLALKASLGAVRFSASQPIALPGKHSFALSDLNADQRMDVVVLSHQDAANRISILIGTSNGVSPTFLPATLSTSLNGYSEIHSLAVGDVNGDQFPDIAVGAYKNPDQGHAFVALHAPGSSFSFTEFARVNECNCPGEPLISLNPSGGLGHLLMACESYQKVGLCENKTKARVLEFANYRDLFSIPGLVKQILSADINNDAFPDLIVSSDKGIMTGKVSEGRPFSLTATQTIDLQSIVPALVTLSDLTDDGRPDLVITHNRIGSDPGRSISVFPGMASGLFVANPPPPPIEVAGDLPRATAVADFDGDGNQDIVVAFYSATPLRFLRGKGRGQFLPATAVPVDGIDGFSCLNVWQMETIDINGDCKPDLLLACENPGGIYVLLNTGDI